MQAKCRETGEIVAIKKVLQDKRYKNRELQIMQMLDHPNIVALKHCFFSTTDKEELYLNLVLEYVPETVNRIARNYSRIHQRMPLIYVKLYTYQVGSNLFDYMFEGIRMTCEKKLTFTYYLSLVIAFHWVIEYDNWIYVASHMKLNIIINLKSIFSFSFTIVFK